LVTNVANVPPRLPCSPQAAAMIDVLSGGHFDLGLGDRAFYDGIAGLGEGIDISAPAEARNRNSGG
jgi:hypothetical protein